MLPMLHGTHLYLKCPVVHLAAGVQIHTAVSGNAGREARHPAAEPLSFLTTGID